MAPYDSDSSGDEANDFTQTNVVLGFASKESADENDTISHLGGRPEWIDPTTPPSAVFAKCKRCNDLMVLLVQLNGDLPQVFPGHERRLYVLSCRRKTCRRKEGSVRVLRGVRISEVAGTNEKKTKQQAEEKEEKPLINIGETLFGSKPSLGSGSSNPFSTASSAASSNPFAAASWPTSELTTKPPQSPTETETLPKTFASALSLNNGTIFSQKFGRPPQLEPWPQESDLPPPYPLYYLEDDIEYLDKISEPETPTQTMDLDEGSGLGGGKEDKEVYESTIDKTFQRFADRLAQNPEQVIRYEFKGQPLLYSKSDAVGKLLSGVSEGEGKVKVAADGKGGRIPRCGNCRAGRVFEVQLTPHAIMELEREEEGVDGMEWGTIVVGVCEKDCGPQGVHGVGYLEEWAGVQWEELGERR